VERVRFSRLWWVGPLAIVASILGNLAVRALALALFDISPAFLPLSTPQPTIFFTAAGVLGAILVFAAVGRFSRQPARTYSVIATVALVLSLIPNVLLLVNPEGAMFGGIDAISVGVLMAQHVVAAAITVWLLLTLAVESPISG
jgi:hypothetical protein